MKKANKCENSDCDKPVNGRSDKKFCSIQCKNKMHNELNAADMKLIKDDLARLKKNRDILKELYALYQSTGIKWSIVQQKGFWSEIIFKQVKTPNKGLHCYILLDYGYTYDVNSQTIKIYKDNELHSL